VVTVFDEWTEDRGTYTYCTHVGGAIIEATVYERKGDVCNWELRMTLAWHFDSADEPGVMMYFTWPTLIYDNKLCHAHWKYCRDAEHGKRTAVREIEAFKRDITKESSNA